MVVIIKPVIKNGKVTTDDINNVGPIIISDVLEMYNAGQFIFVLLMSARHLTR